MSFRVPLSSINASDGNVTYAQGSVIRVGAGGNVNAVGSVVINTAGNVGIGTNDVISPLRIYAFNNTDAVRIRQDGAGNALVVSDAAGDVTPFVVNSNGNVGIGTANPRSPLSVVGNVDVNGNIFVGSVVSGSFVRFESASSTFYIQGSNAEIYMSSIAAEPSSPPSGNLLIYTKAIAGRQMLKIKGASGLDTPLQPILAQNKVCLWNASFGTTTVPGLWGFPAPTTVGTATARSPATTNILTRLKRIAYVSSSGTTGQLASWRLPVAAFTLGGDASNFGGFNTIIRFGISDASLVGVARMFVGMSSSTGAATNVDPGTLTNVIGVGHTTSNTNLYIYYGGSAAQTRIDLGADFPVAITTAYELALFAPPNSNNTVYYRVTNLGTAAEASGTLTAATPGTQLPANTTLLGLQIWRTNNSSTGAVALDISSIYVETDY